MKKNMLLEKVFIATLFCCGLWNTACVNQIEGDDGPTEGNTPITFSIKIKKASTKTSNNLFETGDKVGLYAMLNGVEIDGKRYIDNLSLTCGENNALIPSKSIFYPEGDDAALDFISYYPYRSQGAATGNSTIAIAVQTDQSSSEGYSQSDFLTAKAKKVASSDKAVELTYSHKLSKVRIALTPKKDEDINAMLESNPEIIACGFCTQATYDLTTETFSNHSASTDIISAGNWKIEDGRLTGKEFIIIPQSINDKQSFQIEWNGQIYSCAIPALEKVDGNVQYEIDIATIKAGSNTLNGIIGSINEWPAETYTENTDNSQDYTAVHISVLSFSASNVYRIYSAGTPIAEICKEYLTSDQLTSQAIISYPVKEDETTDLSKGTILSLLDSKEAVNGGTICWNSGENTFTYSPGTSKAINEIYFDRKGNVLMEKPETPINVHVLKYTIRDIREGLQEYPVIKIGTQYWMRKNLCAIFYQDGSPIEKLTELGKDAGYFKPADYDIYFYNGEAVKEKELSPEGWKIPSENDWDKLATYIKGNASLLKAGEWKFAGTDDGTGVVTPATNTAMFSVYPSGMWFGDHHANAYKMTGFWSWDYTGNTIPEKTVFFMGQSNEILKDQTSATGKDYYKALSIRCIKE